MSYSSRAAPAKKTTSDKNLQILKALLKDPSNRYCADCKTGQHPRWASWSLGIFICIRCSGIHRSLGTHISKVRSVDLDTWSDEQLILLINWGNKRANLYWEAKLPSSYVPDDSKIASFIRTKYDLKRWVASQTIPDPATLSEGQSVEGGDVEVAKLVTSSVSKNSSKKPSLTLSKPSASKQNSASLIPDLLGDDAPSFSAPSAATGSDLVGTSHPSRSTGPPAPPKQPAGPPTRPSSTPATAATAKQDSLLFGLDFTSSSSSTPASASSTPPATSGSPAPASSRPDLKKSILSLYSSSSTNTAFAQRAPQQSSSMTSNTSFDINSATSSLSLGSSQSGVTSPQSTSFGLFDNLVSNGRSSNSGTPSTLASNWSTQTNPPTSDRNSLSATPTTSYFSPTPVAKRNDDDDWSYASAPPAQSGNVATTATLSAIPPEEDLFANVWK